MIVEVSGLGSYLTDAIPNAESRADTISTCHWSFCLSLFYTATSIYKAACYISMIVHEFFERIDSLPHSLSKASPSFLVSAFTAR